MRRAFFLLLVALPHPAAADTFTGWVAGKAVTTGGSGDLFKSFDGLIAGGLEGGIELFGIDLY